MYFNVLATLSFIKMYNIRVMKFKTYEEFEAKKIACRDCSVGKVYDRVVGSDGNKISPVVMVIGECPGKDEVAEGKPFVGKAGKLLRPTLNEFGFRRKNALISNVIPCRPENNKFPTDNKLVHDCYSKWLCEEILLTKTKYLLLLGAKPLKFLIGEVGITKVRGKWFNLSFENHNGNAIKGLPTFHPSYVQRKEHMDEGKVIKEQFRNDIKEVATKAGFIK